MNIAIIITVIIWVVQILYKPNTGSTAEDRISKAAGFFISIIITCLLWIGYGISLLF